MKKLLSAALTLAFVLGFLPLSAKADTKLDEIENYIINVEMQSDGSMNITYHIEWKVLDDTSEGPLTWVKIGIPNENVDGITALSSNIRDINYYSDGGDYVRIDLDRAYYADEIIPLDFSIHQSHMYRLDNESGMCSYYFTPGWFEDIDIKSMTILWSGVDVIESDATSVDGRYLVWTTQLAAGESYTIYVNYGINTFDTSEEGPSSSDIGYENADYQPYNDSGDTFGWVPIAIILIVSVIYIIGRAAGGGGGYHGGFGTHGGFGGGGHCACASSCACACGCACACACAGGGRAGCSAKNLFGAVHTDKLKRALQKDIKP